MVPRGMLACFLAAMAMFGCISCGKAAPLSNSAGQVIDDIVRGTRTVEPWVPKITPEEAPAARQSVEIILNPYTAQETEDDAWRIVKGACVANNFYELYQAPTLENAVAKARDQVGGTAAFGSRVTNLAYELKEKKNSWDQTQVAATFAVCEAAEVRLLRGRP